MFALPIAIEMPAAIRYDQTTSIPFNGQTMSNRAATGELYTRAYHNDLITTEHQRQAALRLQKVYNAFLLRLQKKDERIWEGIGDDFITASVVMIGRYFVLSSAKKVSVDITGDKSLFFTVKYSDKNLYLEMFIEDESLSSLVVNFNVMKDGNPHFSFSGAIDETMTKLRELQLI